MIAIREKNTQAKPLSFAVLRDVLVYGAGLAGAQAAVALAERGHTVTLAFPEAEPLADETARMAQFLDAAGIDGETGRLDALRQSILRSPQIVLKPGSEVAAFQGEMGAFRVSLRAQGALSECEVGAVLLACGDAVALPEADLPVAAPRGQTLLSLLPELAGKEALPPRLAFMLDLNAEQGRLVTILALAAARQARLRGCECVRIYCRNVRTGGTLIESLYRAARSVGVEFLRYARPPRCQVSDAGIAVSAEDTQLGRAVEEVFDRVVFADLVPSPRNRRLAELARLRQTPDRRGFLDNVWLLPCESSRRGIFLAGAWGASTDFNELATEAAAASHSIHALLHKGRIEMPDDAARVESEKCVACLTCVRLCPHSAIEFSLADEAASISSRMCRRCGVCAAECPADAIRFPNYDREDIAARTGQHPRVTCFACTNSATDAAAAARAQGLLDGIDLQIVEVPCAGTVDPRDVLKAFERGAERVLVLSCNPESCHYLDGATRAQRRIARIRELMQSAGIDANRLFWGSLTAAETRRLAAFITGRTFSYSLTAGAAGRAAATAALPVA